MKENKNFDSNKETPKFVTYVLTIALFLGSFILGRWIGNEVPTEFFHSPIEIDMSLFSSETLENNQYDIQLKND
jgi:hypothetical protein